MNIEATTKSFAVRPTEAADWDAVADGFARASGQSSAEMRASFAWAMRDNPCGASSVSAFDGTGRAIGHLGVAHLPVRVGESTATFGRYFGCFVDPAYRVGGLHSLLLELDETFRESFEDSDRLAAVVGLWDEADWWFWRHVRGHEALTTSIEVFRGKRAATADVPAGVEIRRGPATDGIGSTFAHRGLEECQTVRTADVMRWRASEPGTDGAVWTAMRGDRVSAVAITRDTSTSRQILDLSFAADEPAAIALLDALAAETQPTRATLWTANPFAMMVLQRAGFRVTAGAESYLSVRPILPRLNQQWLANHWTVTVSDVGRLPMPRLTVGERIVLPPPAGTTSGRTRHGH